MEKRIYGLIGIKAINSNWNADFSGYPKTLPSGEIFASDKSLKYTMRRYWQDQGKPVFAFKSYTLNKKGEIVPRTLEERYNYLFNTEIKKEKEANKVINNLISQTDVRQFGVAFAQQGVNLSLTGAVQIGQGVNKYEDSETYVQDILSPYRNSNKENAKQSTLGDMILVDEAHYFYNFTINPNEYKGYPIINEVENYTEEDYKNFKNAAIQSVSLYNSNTKRGCENEFAMFVETDKNTYLPSLDQFIKFYKEEYKNVIEFTGFNISGEIEIYVDPNVILKGFPAGKVFNIYTKEEI